jgi:hypothetical protein
MIRRLATLGLGFALATGAGAQARHSFGRTYVVGQKQVYAVKVQLAAAPKAAYITMTMTEEVLRVYANGEADVKTVMSDVVGFERTHSGTQPAPPQKTARLDRLGLPSAAEMGTGDQLFSSISGLVGVRAAMMVGKSVPFESKHSAQASTYWAGRATLVEVKNGVAKVHVVADTKDKASHMVEDYTFDAKTSVMLTMSGKMVPTAGKAFGIRIAVKRKGA